jgi:hypothetical protein
MEERWYKATMRPSPNAAARGAPDAWDDQFPICQPEDDVPIPSYCGKHWSGPGIEIGPAPSAPRGPHPPPRSVCAVVARHPPARSHFPASNRPPLVLCPCVCRSRVFVLCCCVCVLWVPVLSMFTASPTPEPPARAGATSTLITATENRRSPGCFRTSRSGPAQGG